MNAHCEIHHGDMRELLPRWTADVLRVSTVICDPPYHLTSIEKRFGKEGAAPAQHGKDGATGRLSKGFMAWDGDSGDIAFQPDTWRYIRDILIPGGRVAVFGGTRTFWRVAAAMDAAGLLYEDTIAWVYGQGLVLRHSRLKPCWEPIMLWRTPGRVLDLNIEASRVPFAADEGSYDRTHEPTQETRYADTGGTNFAAKPGRRVVRKSLTSTEAERAAGDRKGRWPSNFIHDSSDDVMSQFPDAPGQIAPARRDGTLKKANVYGALNHSLEEAIPRTDSGSAARFFTTCPFSPEEDIQRIAYQAKAPAAERPYRCTVCGSVFGATERSAHAHGLSDTAHIQSHPTLKPLALVRHLVRLLVPPDGNGLVLDPFAGSGTTGVAALAEGVDSILIEKSAAHIAECRFRIARRG